VSGSASASCRRRFWPDSSPPTRRSTTASSSGRASGRDAAAIALGDRILVAKTDPITFATEHAATYLVDVNGNDLACLGARPRWLLVTALLPEGITAGEVEAQFAELAAVCAARNIALVGGHTEVSAGWIGRSSSV
jgi:hydrogenase maturation factor